MKGLEVHHRSGTTKIEDVLASAEVARAAALLTAHVGESMFDGDPFAQAFAESR
jgi:hypothetical protein